MDLLNPILDKMPIIIKDYFALDGEVSVKSIVDANGEIYNLNDII